MKSYIYAGIGYIYKLNMAAPINIEYPFNVYSSYYVKSMVVHKLYIYENQKFYYYIFKDHYEHHVYTNEK